MSPGPVVVFMGPTLSVADARPVLDAEYRPPAEQGDVYRVVEREDPFAIGIVDGYFERVPSVWHKELLYAMSEGVHCYGAASMGALRAAELEAFGMVGVGWVFEQFSSGRMKDDDEVTIVHDPESHGRRYRTEAMVNIRATLERAADRGVIGEEVASRLTVEAKELFYRNRSYDRVLEQGRRAGVPDSEIRRLEDWLPAGAVDVKREDALEMLRALARLRDERPGPMRPAFTFEDTLIWRDGMGELDSA